MPRLERTSRLTATVSTPAEVRTLVRACEGATRVDLPRLRELVRDADDALVVRHALRALARAGRELDPALVERLDDGRAPVRHAALRALGETRDRAALVHLERALADDDDTARRLAIHAVGRIGGRRAEALLERVGRTASDETDRAFARSALAGARTAVR